jgi:Na+/proline symporter
MEDSRMSILSQDKKHHFRFGLPTRIFASLAFTFQMAMYMSIVLYAPAIAFEAVTGLSYIASILSIGLVCTFYSTIGGMKAVLINGKQYLLFTSILMLVARFELTFCIIQRKYKSKFKIYFFVQINFTDS